MSSVRLRTDQIAKLRKSGNGAAIIRYAVARYKSGKLPVPEDYATMPQGCLHIYAVWRKPEGITDMLLRAILDAHFTTPDVERQQELERSIAHLDKIIAQEFALLASKGPFIIEDVEQGED